MILVVLEMSHGFRLTKFCQPQGHDGRPGGPRLRRGARARPGPAVRRGVPPTKLERAQGRRRSSSHVCTCSASVRESRRRRRPRCQSLSARAYIRVEGTEFVKFSKMSSWLPNCWSLFFLVLPNFLGCQLHLANSWRCLSDQSSIKNFDSQKLSK